MFVHEALLILQFSHTHLARCQSFFGRLYNKFGQGNQNLFSQMLDIPGAHITLQLGDSHWQISKHPLLVQSSINQNKKMIDVSV